MFKNVVLLKNVTVNIFVYFVFTTWTFIFKFTRKPKLSLFEWEQNFVFKFPLKLISQGFGALSLWFVWKSYRFRPTIIAFVEADNLSMSKILDLFRRDEPMFHISSPPISSLRIRSMQWQLLRQWREHLRYFVIL